MENSETQQLKKSRKIKDFKVKQLTSLVLVSVIIPFLVFGSMPYGSEYITYGYDIFFIVVIGLACSYTIYELTSFIFDKKQNFKVWFVNFIFLLLLTNFMFFYPASQMIVPDQMYWDLASTQNLLIESFNWILYLLLIFVGMFLYFVVAISVDNDGKDNATALVFTMLIAIFFTSLVFVAKYFSYAVLFLPILICIFSDTAAYIGGKKLGKNHPFPYISPNKTTEGLIIGFLAGVAVGLFWYFIVINSPWTTTTPLVKETLSIGFAIVMIIVLSIISPFGDLMFSKIKRSYNKKDFGTLLPGHGGVLDRIDSHILVTSMTSLFLILSIIV